MADDRPWSQTARAADIEANRRRMHRADRRRGGILALCWLIATAAILWLLTRAS